MSDPCATPGLMPVVTARARLLASVQAVDGVEEVPLAEAVGRVLATDVTARVDVPPADNSAMDGYALRLADLQAAAGTLPVSQRIPAGHVPVALAPATAARLFTGAEIPTGADTVVMQEDCEAGEGRVSVRIDALAKLHVGDNIRPRGQDLPVGEIVLNAGVRLGAAAVGVAAAAGHAALPVFRRVRVAILSTGDELQEPGEAPRSGGIYNSNRYLLQAFLTEMGCKVVDPGRVADRRADTLQAIRAAALEADLVLTTGGASVGEEDHLAAALREAGRVDLWKVAIKPGKPLLFGHLPGAGREVPLLGLPGNPASVAVTFLVFAVPFLRVLQGTSAPAVEGWPVPAGFVLNNVGNRDEYLRVRLAEGRLERYPNQSSGVLRSLAWADGLAVVPAGSRVARGSPLQYLPLTLLLG